MGELAVNNVIRPNPVVLPDSAQVPERNVVKPPPNRFTHEVVAEMEQFLFERCLSVIAAFFHRRGAREKPDFSCTSIFLLSQSVLVF